MISNSMEVYLDCHHEDEKQYLMAYVDGQLKSEENKKIARKIQKDHSFKQLLLNVEREYDLVEKLIPIRKLDSESKEELALEIAKTIKAKKALISPNKISRTLRLIHKIEKELRGIIVSKEMVKYYLLVVVVGGLVKLAI